MQCGGVAGPCRGQPSLRNGRKARGAQVGLSVPSENEMERVHHSVSGLPIWRRAPLRLLAAGNLS